MIACALVIRERKWNMVIEKREREETVKERGRKI